MSIDLIIRRYVPRLRRGAFAVHGVSVEVTRPRGEQRYGRRAQPGEETRHIEGCDGGRTRSRIRHP